MKAIEQNPPMTTKIQTPSRNLYEKGINLETMAMSTIIRKVAPSPNSVILFTSFFYNILNGFTLLEREFVNIETMVACEKMQNALPVFAKIVAIKVTQKLLTPGRNING